MKHKLAFAFDTSWGCYTDASWSPEGDYSHQAVVIYYGNNLVAWQSQRQSLVALSGAEAELIAFRVIADMSGSMTCGSSRPSLGVQVLAVFSFIS